MAKPSTISKILTVSYLSVLFFPIYASAKPSSSDLIGKTFVIIGAEKICHNNTACKAGKIKSKIYFSKDGNIFVYYAKNQGVMIKKGNRIGSSYEVINKEPLELKASIAMGENNIDLIYDINGLAASYKTNIRLSVDSKKCRLVEYKLSAKALEKLTIGSSPVSCQIFNGRR